LIPGILSAQQVSSISQYGITWTFDTQYQSGQFANGDYWVVGPVTITSMTPAFDGSSNGWEVNPISNRQQGFDSGCGDYNGDLTPDLPYTAQPGESIVKAISSGGGVCLQTAAVLTVVSAVPPDNGASVFRPPYVGTEKPYYSIDDLRTNLLPSLAPVERTPTLSWVVDRFSRIQLDHEQGSMGRSIRPRDNMPDYGSAIARDNGDAALRLMLNDPIADKMNALIVYVQYGIDLHYAIENGQSWPSGGGYNPGRKLPLTFAAIMLDVQAMKNNVLRENFFNEDRMLYWSETAGRALFGYNRATDEEDYWSYLRNPGSSREYADPYGYIDGGIPTDGYQFCCLSQPWKSATLAVDLMPELKILWTNAAFFDYVYRWVTVGTWTLPDPCAPVGGTYGVDYGPDGTGDCIKGSGRFPQNHGENTDAGEHASRFARNLWNAYHEIDPNPNPNPDPDPVPPEQVSGVRIKK
jgi:hypothetical protein